MGTEGEAYELLGLLRPATPDEAKRAYHEAALKYHPDLHGDDPDILRKFYQINEAYQVVVQNIVLQSGQASAVDAPTFSPRDFALQGFGTPSVIAVEANPAAGSEGADKISSGRLTVPTRNETFAFVCFWTVSLLFSGVVCFLAAGLLFAGRTFESLGALEVCLFAGMTLLAYVIGVGMTLLGLVLTRKTLWLVMRARLGWQRALCCDAAADRLVARS